MTDDLHDQLRDEIPGLVAGRLDESARRVLLAHIESCTECAHTLAVTKEIAETLNQHRDVIGSPHPDVAKLRRFALGPPPAGGDEIERHVRICASCSLEVAAWRRGTTMATQVPRSRRSTLVAVATLAAGLIIGAILAPRIRPPGTAPEGPDLRVADGLRGNEDEPIVEISPDRPVVIEFKWDSLEPVESIGGLEFVIVRVGGSEVWSTRLDAERVSQIVRGGGVFSLAVSPQALGEGTYELRVVSARPASGPPWVQQRFRTHWPSDMHRGR